MSDIAGVPFAGASRYHSHSLVDGRQLVAGRAIVGWTVREMAAKAGLAKSTVNRVENEHTLPTSAYAADKMAKALEDAGVTFGSHAGGLTIHFDAPTRRTVKRYRRKTSAA